MNEIDELNLFIKLSKYPNAIERQIWLKKLPHINFPEKYSIEELPPHNPAIIHYHIKLKENPKIKTSVYLDCYNLLGCYGKPYWEIYPMKDNEIKRCDMYDIDKLLKYIDLSLKDQIKNDKKKKQ